MAPHAESGGFVPDHETCQRLAARVLSPLYALTRSRSLLALIARIEGGHMRSRTLRVLLARHHDVRVGAHSYGALLVPGNADVMTSIGRYVSIGPNVRRLGAAHPIDEVTLHPYWYHPTLGRPGFRHDVPRTPIVIEDDCWIGANTVILPGCTRIGVGAVVGAGSVVTHDVPDFAVVMGVPARQRSLRLNEGVRRRLLETRPWSLPPAQCEAALQEAVRDS